MHGAGTTLADTAAKLSARQLERIAQHPEQGCIPFDVDLMMLAVDLKRKAHAPPRCSANCRWVKSRSTACCQDYLPVRNTRKVNSRRRAKWCAAGVQADTDENRRKGHLTQRAI